jgi:hypothetical protein
MAAACKDIYSRLVPYWFQCPRSSIVSGAVDSGIMVAETVIKED